MNNKALTKTLFVVGLMLAIASTSVISIVLSRQLGNSQDPKNSATKIEADSKAKRIDNQISQLQNYLADNVSKVSNLKLK